jgi:hypothetical protein
MKLYHATSQGFKINQIVGPFSGTHFIEQKVKPNNLYYVEEFLESHRPCSKVSRLSAIFAFDKPEYCLRFLQAECRGSLRVYEIEMQSPSSSPMCLVDSLRDKNLPPEIKVRLANEYWDPTRDWSFMEYMSDSMVIKLEVNPEEYRIASYAVGFSYAADKSQVRELLNEPKEA